MIDKLKNTLVINAVFDGLNSSMSTMSTFVSEWNIFYEVKSVKEKMKIVFYVLSSLLIGSVYSLIIFYVLK